jgi:hypothetical protein
MNEFQILKKLVAEGVELTFGKMSLCDLSHYQNFRGNRKWQVYCADRREEFYFVYKDLTEAIVKFLELKKRIGTKVR